MRYTVEWTDAALNELAAIWMRAADPEVIREGSNRVDRELAYSPETKGVDFYGDRLLVEAPLHVVYTIDPAKRQVTVQRVWSV
jgi:hypothetical protein